MFWKSNDVLFTKHVLMMRNYGIVQMYVMRFTTAFIRESVQYEIYGYPIRVLVWVTITPRGGVSMDYGLLANGFSDMSMATM